MDAVCSGADEAHDALLRLLGDIFPIQFKIMETAEFLSALRSLVPVVFSE